MELARPAGEDLVAYEPVLGQWFVFGYDEVRSTLADGRLTADRMHGFEDRAPPDAVDAVRRHAPWVISTDEDGDYAWIRWILHAGLRGAMGEASERAIASAANELLDDLVQLSVGAANRDPARFPDPDRFDVTRPQGGALGFGHGAHSCIGAGLSRMQTPIAVGALLERAADLELDPDDEPVWSAVPGVRGIEGLSLRRPAARAARRPR